MRTDRWQQVGQVVGAIGTEEAAYPTATDTLLRKQTVQGQVDETANAQQGYIRPRMLVTAGAKLTAQDGLVEVYLSVPDLDVETTIRICAHPGFVVDRRTLASKV